MTASIAALFDDPSFYNQVKELSEKYNEEASERMLGDKHAAGPGTEHHNFGKHGENNKNYDVFKPEHQE